MTQTTNLSPLSNEAGLAIRRICEPNEKCGKCGKSGAFPLSGLCDDCEIAEIKGELDDAGF